MPPKPPPGWAGPGVEPGIRTEQRRHLGQRWGHGPGVTTGVALPTHSGIPDTAVPTLGTPPSALQVPPAVPSAPQPPPPLLSPRVTPARGATTAHATFRCHPRCVSPPHPSNATLGLLLRPPPQTPSAPDAPKALPQHPPPSRCRGVAAAPAGTGGCRAGSPRGCAAAEGARRRGRLGVPSSLPTTKEFCEPRCRHISQAT